jgi:hypothetical protein
MKRLFLLPVLCMALAGSAQVRWGVLAGWQSSNIGRYDLISSSGYSAPSIGLMSDIDIHSSSFHVLVQAGYTSLGYRKSNIQAVDKSGNTMGNIGEHRISYIKLPVYFLYGGYDKKMSTRINGGLGPFLAFKTNDKLKIAGGDNFGNETVLPGGVKKITPLLAGLSFHASVDWSAVRIALHFEQSFNGIYRNQTMGPKWRVHDFGISLGYFFAPKFKLVNKNTF